MARTIKERLTQGLQDAGWVPDINHRSTKYQAFKPGERLLEKQVERQPDQRLSGTERIFLGTAGALRYSKSGGSAASFSSLGMKTRLLARVPQ